MNKVVYCDTCKYLVKSNDGYATNNTGFCCNHPSNIKTVHTFLRPALKYKSWPYVINANVDCKNHEYPSSLALGFRLFFNRINKILERWIGETL